VHGIGKEKDSKNDQKKNGVEDSCPTIERVAEEMKNDEERRGNVAQKKYGVERPENKPHGFYFYSDPVILSLPGFPYNNTSLFFY